MPYVNYTMMGSAINSVLTLSHFAACGIMNEFVTLESKR
jgi:hypothetical protein